MVKLISLIILFAALATCLAALPAHKIRGVNLGSLFIIEPWMMRQTWKAMGCGATKSEWDCVALLGQRNADKVFQKHWNTFITADDFDKMAAYGLNTVRIPVGHWFVEETIVPGEQWPLGGMRYLDTVANLAASRNMSVILDLHGAPGVQVPNNPFTGHTTSPTHFYTSKNYARAYTFLRNITHRIHTLPQYRSTIMLEVLNEPERSHSSLINTYYPTAYTTIRSTESSLKIPRSKALTIQFMASSWGAGNPRQDLPRSAYGVSFDAHRYLAYSDVPVTKDAYLNASCTQTFPTAVRDGNKPLVVGEWSLAVKRGVEWNQEFSPLDEGNREWYRRWWAAQVRAYERQKGWVFWSWKTELGRDWRWSYEAAVQAGIISRNLDGVEDIAGC